jgi:hypothetical protein
LLRGVGSVVPPSFHESLLELARAKLIGSHKIDASYTDFPTIVRMAVLDVQLSLDYEPRREWIQGEQSSMVESHMRIAYSIPSHREYLRSGYPSEPLLAEAAAQQLWKWRSQEPLVVIKTLNEIHTTGFLDRGELGELTGRQLLLDAYHRAVELEQNCRPNSKIPPNFSAGCQLITFFKMLYNEKEADMILDSYPDNMMDEPMFRDAFKDARVCFTHFGKMMDDTGVTSDAACAAFVRHMGIMCHNSQKSVDCILPVLLYNAKICEHVMSAVLIQFKRQKTAGTINKYTIDQSEINFFPKESNACTHGFVFPKESNACTDDSKPQLSYRPYISLIMELGVQLQPPQGAKTPVKYDVNVKLKAKQTGLSTSSHETPSTPSKLVLPQLGKKHHPVKDQHQRYNIFSYGCSPTLFKGVHGAKDMYALLLNSRDFLGEHPRQNPPTLTAVRRMKPFWSGGENCYHWYQKNDALQSPVGEEEEVFFVGHSADALL